MWMYSRKIEIPPGFHFHIIEINSKHQSSFVFRLKLTLAKAKRYTLQSDSMHPNKKVSITTITSTKHSCIQEIIVFVARWYCTYNTSTDTNAFSKVFS